MTTKTKSITKERPMNPSSVNRDQFTRHIQTGISFLDKEIAQLTKQRAVLVAALGKAQPAKGPSAARPAAARPAVAARPNGGAAPTPGARKGYITHVLNYLGTRPEAHADQITEHVKRQRGLESASRKAIDNTLAAELKKPNSRIERTQPGIYRLSPAAFDEQHGARPQVEREAEPATA